MRDNVPTRVNFIENALALGGVIMVMSRLVNLSFVLVLKVLTEISPLVVTFFVCFPGGGPKCVFPRRVNLN